MWKVYLFENYCRPCRITSYNVCYTKLLRISEESDFLNVDGDRAAAYVAGKVGTDKVLFITNVDGLLMDGKLVPKLTLAEAKEIRPKIGPGMEKKILASTEALDMGVKEALIANGQKDVITSYSIHYTKLYDINLIMLVPIPKNKLPSDALYTKSSATS